ncbi:hypothetical protein [Shewanella sp. 30m-9]
MINGLRNRWSDVAEKEKTGLMTLAVFFIGVLVLAAGIKISSAIGTLILQHDEVPPH